MNSDTRKTDAWADMDGRWLEGLALAIQFRWLSLMSLAAGIAAWLAR